MIISVRVLLLPLLWVFFALPAIADQEPPAMRLSEVTRGTLLLETGKPGEYRPAPVQQTEARIRIVGPIARTVLRQRFGNPGTSWAEALYAFPLPEDAAVDRMRLRIGDRIVEGEIQEKQQARRTYERARNEGKRAALVEQHRPNLFTTAVANIPPQGEVTVEIEYQQALHWRDERFSLRFPMAITPRFRPAQGRVEQDIDLSGGWSILPGELPNVVDLSTVTGDKKQADLNPASLHVTLEAGFPLGSLQSRYHQIEQSESQGRHLITLRDGAVPAEHDFELVWQPLKSAAPQAAFFLDQNARGNFGMLMLMPPAQAFEGQAPLRREVIYVIDTSGSMGGKSMREAKAALALAMQRLKSGDYFNIIEFNSDATALFAQPSPVDLDSRSRALDFIDGLGAGGGTNIHRALELAFAQGISRPGYLRQIVFMTDGAVSNEAQLFRQIDAGLGEGRLFTVGIGSAPNSHFMTEAARLGRGSFTYIGNVAEVQEKMDGLFRRIEAPALTDLSLDLPTSADLLPDPIPDLYLGEPLSVVMKLDGLPDRATVKGRIGGVAWQSTLSLGAGKGAGAGGTGQQSGLDVRWARDKIAHWEREGVRGLSADQVRRNILKLALDYHLVSRFTSLVAVDRTPVRPADEDLQAHALKNNLPEGWQPGARVVQMAQGGTLSLLSLMLGLPLLLISGAARWLRR